MFIYPLFLTCLVSIVTFYQHLYHKVCNCQIHNLNNVFSLKFLILREMNILEFWILEIFY